MSTTTQHLHVSEREAIDIRAGRWGSIDKEQHRPYRLEQAVSIPVLQGVAAFAAIGTPVTVIFWMIWGWKVGLSAGCITASLAFAVVVVQGIVYSRAGLDYSEYWQSEDLHRNTQTVTETEKATVRVEVVDYASNPDFPVFQNDEMRIDHGTLAIVAHRDTRLSKRGLMDIGIDAEKALTVLQELSEFRYIQSDKSNKPATWTNKGLALCRVFGGGGGGGGSVETTETSIVPVE